MKRGEKMKKKEGKKMQVKKQNKGVTLISLVVTIIVLLILARSKYIHANRTKWIDNTSK